MKNNYCDDLMVLFELFFIYLCVKHAFDKIVFIGSRNGYEPRNDPKIERTAMVHWLANYNLVNYKVNKSPTIQTIFFFAECCLVHPQHE